MQGIHVLDVSQKGLHVKWYFGKSGVRSCRALRCLPCSVSVIQNFLEKAKLRRDVQSRGCRYILRYGMQHSASMDLTSAALGRPRHRRKGLVKTESRYDSCAFVYRTNTSPYATTGIKVVTTNCLITGNRGDNCVSINRDDSEIFVASHFLQCKESQREDRFQSSANSDILSKAF